MWWASVLADHAVFRLFWHNWASVLPGRIYRSNHPTPAYLARQVKRFGLRTVINLRGEKPNPSTTLSAAACAALGIDHIFLPFDSRGAPHRDRILRFYDLYRTLQTPALLHCKSGADRAGLAAGMVLLFEGGTAADALDQLSWRFLHVRQSRTGILDAFFRLYAAQAEGRLRFIDWVEREYDEAALARSFTAGRWANFLNDRLLARE